jgi:hypothetical protein
MRANRFHRSVAGLAAASLLGLSMFQPATAAVIGTDEAIAIEQGSPGVDDFVALFARADVRQQLETLGVDPEQAAERVAALSEQELAEIQRSIDEMPAGGSALAVIGVVFLVLIILEVVGVTDIFKKV